MSKYPKWLQGVLSFIIDNFSMFLTIGFAGFLIYRQKIAVTTSIEELVTGVLTVLGLLAISEIVVRYRQLQHIERTIEGVDSLIRNRFADCPSAIMYLRKPPDLQTHIQSSKEIDLCGVCLTSTINKQFSTLCEQLKIGARIRILIMAPDSQAVEVAGFRSEVGDAEYYKKRLAATFQDLEYLYKSWRDSAPAGSGELHVRLLQYPPSFGIHAFDSNRTSGVMFVEFYPHKSAAESPILELRFDRDGKWYQYFSNQFDKMWVDAQPWEHKNSVVAAGSV
jgi:hypothetical protein